MLKSRNPKIEFDRLRMYFNEPYVIDVEDAEGIITVYPPTIGDVIEFGEKKFFQSLRVFTTNTTENRLMLWDIGIDWNEFSDFNLFCLMIGLMDEDIWNLFFHDVDLEDFQQYSKKVDEDHSCTVLYNPVDGVEINEMVYFHLSQYFRAMFNIYPEEKLTDSGVLKGWYIDKDRRDLKLKQEIKKDDESFSMLPAISAYVNHPGTKYKTKELKEVGICEFYDSVQRLQIYESATACLKGMFSGMVDAKKIKPEEYNFMREIKT